MQKRRIRAALPAAGEDGLKIQRHVGVVMGQRDANPRQAQRAPSPDRIHSTAGAL